MTTFRPPTSEMPEWLTFARDNRDLCIGNVLHGPEAVRLDRVGGWRREFAAIMTARGIEVES